MRLPTGTCNLVYVFKSTFRSVQKFLWRSGYEFLSLVCDVLGIRYHPSPPLVFSSCLCLCKTSSSRPGGTPTNKEYISVTHYFESTESTLNNGRDISRRRVHNLLYGSITTYSFTAKYDKLRAETSPFTLQASVHGVSRENYCCCCLKTHIFVAAST